jgi:hypothetical protein
MAIAVLLASLCWAARPEVKALQDAPSLVLQRASVSSIAALRSILPEQGRAPKMRASAESQVVAVELQPVLSIVRKLPPAP